MTSAAARHSGTALYPLHPLHAFVLAGIVPLFIGALLNDYAYWTSYELQWKNFASWLLIGALLFNGLAWLGSIVSLVRADKHMGAPLAYFLLLLATFVLGVINSLIHAKDVWASMPAGMIVSLITVILACAATWIGLASWSIGGAR
ncbi:DUF2231 domain-containing protein [uncultured Marinobacter sp.]|uniref:DUF2231 domain-containing protein n=1 Tax=uncultured Marinobacter sp. TaxID=187379 RepID=UPI002628D85D|nr:DUF2231 domain-containing protein [uncultured Marinobacter sp.]